jgi:hypothetical protein
MLNINSMKKDLIAISASNSTRSGNQSRKNLEFQESQCATSRTNEDMPLSIENRKIPNSLKNLNLPLSNDLYNNPKW